MRAVCQPDRAPKIPWTRIPWTPIVAVLIALVWIPIAPMWAEDAPAKPTFDITGGIYLFEYLPQLEGTHETFEIYAFLLNFDAATASQRYGLHVQTRARDSKLRSYFVSDVWFQEAYVWMHTGIGDVHAGKFYRRVGLLWDDSFFGNVQYFNGFKLNPDYGVELVGSPSIGDGVFLDYSVQHFANNDRVAGSLPDRDVEGDPNAALRNTQTARVAPRWELGTDRSLSVGLSGMDGRIDREVGSDFHLRQIAVDATLTWGRSISYAEWLRQDGEPFDAAHPDGRPGYDDADYWLVGTRWQVHPRLNLRLNYSRADYRGQQATEVEILPGAVVTITDPLDLIVEYDWWKRMPDQGPDNFIDKSLSVVLHYSF